MKLTLQIIFEKLNLPQNQMVLDAPNHSFYSDIQLLSPALKTLKQGVLYIGENSAIHDIPAEVGYGLCLLNQTSDFSCDILFVNSKISLFELFNNISNIFSELRSKFEELTQAILHKKGLQQIIEIVSDICGNPVYLVDSSFKVLGIYGPDTMPEMSVTWRRLLNDGYMPYKVVMNLIESHELLSMETGQCADLILSKYFYTPFINYNMRYKGKLQGHLFVVGMLKKITPGDVDLTNQLGPYILDALRSDPAFQTTRGRYYEHFIIDMLEGKTLENAYIKNKVKALNLKMDPIEWTVRKKGL
jgi:hypothetical protein